MKPATSSAALRVQAILGDDFSVREFDESTRTAADAAAAVGCTVAQIAKSMMFVATPSNRSVLVITSGSNRVDPARVAALIGETVSRADADFVREATGYSIGGVPPLGHRVKPLTLIDADLFQFSQIWAAAGTPNAVFRLTPDDLVRLTGGRAESVAQR
jgi:prolyl-tRNA editing enzyme YbaK/EbsC (Cys-tRNA(Pro) deacylase)